MKNKPAYAIESVDHALHLGQLLQQEGSLRVTDAAERLGVSRSTAHRLLAMLVYRSYAEQGDDRAYLAGHLLRPTKISEAPITLLRRVCLPHLHALSTHVGESTNLMVLVGTEARFIATVESDQPLRVGDRVGSVLPARLASGGQALLATLSSDELGERYSQHADTVDLPRLRRQITHVRKRGFAINDQRTEAGLTALGMAIHDGAGKPCGAFSIALPSARFQRRQLPTWVAAMTATARAIRHDLTE